mmetsp:Transcript_6735/g.17258  ORF Transcript_6735/g.17258 Transcript_6735/m.17258 type:complete len:283 (-) Transcript_6735:492-1340(-)
MRRGHAPSGVHGGLRRAAARVVHGRRPGPGVRGAGARQGGELRVRGGGRRPVGGRRQRGPQRVQRRHGGEEGEALHGARQGRAHNVRGAGQVCGHGRRGLPGAHLERELRGAGRQRAPPRRREVHPALPRHRRRSAASCVVRRRRRPGVHVERLQRRLPDQRGRRQDAEGRLLRRRVLHVRAPRRPGGVGGVRRRQDARVQPRGRRREERLRPEAPEFRVVPHRHGQPHLVGVRGPFRVGVGHQDQGASVPAAGPGGLCAREHPRGVVAVGADQQRHQGVVG